MIDRIRLQFSPAQTSNFLAGLRVRLDNPDVATMKSQRPITWMPDCSRSHYQLAWPHSIDVMVQTDGLVEIEGSASRQSGYDSPVRASHFPHTSQSDSAQASLLLDNSSLFNAVAALTRQVIPEIDDETIRNATVTRIDIPINLSCPQSPLHAILSAAASSQPGCTLMPYAHGEVRNLAIKQGRVELVLYNKALQMHISNVGISRLEFRIKGSNAISEMIPTRTGPWGSRAALRVCDLCALVLYRALSGFVHELVGDRREVLDVASGNLEVGQALEIIAAEAAQQGLLIDGMTVDAFLAHATTPRRARAVSSRLASLQRSSFDLDDILPRNHWNPRYLVPDVLAHLAAMLPTDAPAPSAARAGRTAVDGTSCRPRGIRTGTARSEVPVSSQREATSAPNP